MSLPDDQPGRIGALLDALCQHYVGEAELLVAQHGTLPTTLVVLPGDAAAPEVAIRLEGLRGDLAARASAIVAELRPQVAPHSPRGLVFLTAHGRDEAAVYVTLGADPYRRVAGFRIEALRLVPAAPPNLEAYTWLDALLGPAR